MQREVLLQSFQNLPRNISIVKNVTNFLIDPIHIHMKYVKKGSIYVINIYRMEQMSVFICVKHNRHYVNYDMYIVNRELEFRA